MSFAYFSAVGMLCDDCYRCASHHCTGRTCDAEEHDHAMLTPDYRDPIPACALCGALLDETFHTRDTTPCEEP